MLIMSLNKNQYKLVINLTIVKKYCEIFCILSLSPLVIMNLWHFVFNCHSQLITKEKSPKLTLDNLIKLFKRGTFELCNTIFY